MSSASPTTALRCWPRSRRRPQHAGSCWVIPQAWQVVCTRNEHTRAPLRRQQVGERYVLWFFVAGDETNSARHGEPHTALRAVLAGPVQDRHL
jgi:hypothetical protein